MDLLEDPIFKTKYQKNKIKLKLWESDFIEKYKRKPTKNDFKAADATIREAYKMYFKLKTRALEETLTEINFCEDADENLPNNSFPDSFSLSETTLSNPSLDNSKLLAEMNTVESENNHSREDFTEEINAISPNFSPEAEVNVKGVWGKHLNIQKESKVNHEKTLQKSTSFQLSKNKFSKFSKRNPRKPASISKLNNKSKEDLSKTIDQVEKNDSVIENDLDISDIFDSSQSENFKVVNIEKKICTQSFNTFQHLMEKPSLTCNRQLNSGWLSRNVGDTPECGGEKIQSQRLSNDSGFDTMESTHSSNQDLSLRTPVTENDKRTLKACFADDAEEDFVYNSDSEEQNQKKRVRNLSKIISASDLQPAKRFCFENPSILTEEKTEITPSKSSEMIQEIFPLKYNMKSSNSGTESLNVNTVPTKANKFFKSKSSNVNEKPSNDNSQPTIVKLKLPNTDAQESKKTTYARKKQSQAVKKQGTRKSTRKKSNKEDYYCEDEKIEQKVEIEEQPIYSIESMDVVPRLALDTKPTGNLITDFSRVLEPSNLNSEATNTKTKTENNSQSNNLHANNYVRINLKKKVFVRGRKNFNYAKYKKNLWKQRKKELASGEGSLEIADTLEKNGMKCFKCGETGHFSRQCPNSKEDELISLEVSSGISDFPTLQEAEEMAKLNRPFNQSNDVQPRCLAASSDHQEKDDADEDETNLDDFDFSDWNSEPKTSGPVYKIPENLVEKLLPPVVKEVKPIYELEPDGSVKDTPLEVSKALAKFGHKSFRPGQEEAIMRILSGKSTLVTLATGSGKSLCYQLPAYMYAKESKCITLVISPLVSLMDDQVSGIPEFVSAACFHTNQTPKVREKTMEKLKEGKLSILLVSPEAIVAGEKSNGFGGIFRDLPPVAFACIDEAHCISQWSHNFRPSYLMVSRVLREKLGVKRILALTATASKATVLSMINLLHIPDGLAGVITEKPLPSNLNLSVSRDEQRDQALVTLLCSDRFADCNSIIVYCTRREECARIAGLLRASLQDKPTKLKKKMSEIAEAYHAGLPAYKRKQVQTAFMNSEVRIVVATVAFGMGINKPDIRSVIHFNMPASFESYVQEIGRAGRDGLPAHCHLFLSPTENLDEYELRRHINANGIDRHTIRRLLQKIFIPCHCARLAKFSGARCPGHEVAFGIEETVNALDISEETIATLLCYLELHPKSFIKVLSNAYTSAKVYSYAGSNALKLAAQHSPPLAMAIASALKNGTYHENNASIEFPVIDIAAAIGWDSGLVKSQLKNLEWTTVNGKSKRSPLTIKYDKLGFRIKAPGDLSNEELDEALESLYQRSKSQETLCFKQLKAISAATRKFSFNTVRACLRSAEQTTTNSESLKNTIRSYFELEDPLATIELSSPDAKLEKESQVVGDIRSLITSYRDNNFTGRSIARIFHGIQSPNYPAVTWCKCRFWRAHLADDFNAIYQLAEKEILKFKEL